MPAGSSPKREREYKELKTEFKKEGRYKGREDEVAARIVNKQRAQHGEAKSSSGDAKSGSAKSAGSNSGAGKSSGASKSSGAKSASRAKKH